MMESEVREIQHRSGEAFRLVAFHIRDWNRDLSPWTAPAVFGKEGFGAGAEDTLREIREFCSDPAKKYIIGGYSLAGLFALWAAYQANIFSAVAAASPSVWFPGFTDYMKSHRISSSHVYLSLGDKEAKTRNPVMSTVSDCIREAHRLLLASGTSCTLEWNPGNHFREPDIRTAKAFAWALNQSSRTSG